MTMIIYLALTWAVAETIIAMGDWDRARELYAQRPKLTLACSTVAVLGTALFWPLFVVGVLVLALRVRS